MSTCDLRVHCLLARFYIALDYLIVKMPQDLSQDVLSIKEWLAKEPHLPKDIDELMLRKFVHSCYGSLEQTKKCIDRFCSGRSTMTEIYTSRDPMQPKLQTSFSITNVVTYKINDGQELLIHQLDDPGLEKLNFYDALKTFTIQADFWLKTHDFLAEGHLFIFDLKDISLKVLPKVNIMYFREFLMFLLEGMPVRVKQVHVVNCPSYYEKLYALVKPVLPAEICSIIKFHSTNETLHKQIQKKYLPSEYGGDLDSIKDQQRDWVKRIENNREMFQNDNLWKADLTKKQKNNVVQNTMSGSFRTLSID